MNSDDPTYPGGFPAILDLMDQRRDPLTCGPGEALPRLDIDLVPLRDAIVRDPATDPAEPPPKSSHARKRRDLRQAFAGRSELCCLNALLIAHLRKRDQPPHTAALFQRLWAEQSAHLIANLDARWLVSSVTTFGDHGATPAQRSTGLALNVLFGMTKLLEAERLYSGTPPDQAFALGHKVKAALPMQMDPYSLRHGGLDVNLLGRLWIEAGTDPVIAPLAQHLLERLIQDDRTLFRRFAAMRARQARRDKTRQEKAKPARPRVREIAAAPDPAPQPNTGPETGPAPRNPRWGLVATLRAPLADIARFAAHHLDLGAHALHLYLDDPDPQTAAYLARHPRIHVTQCDAAWWRGTGKDRPDAHQLRQVHNATRTLHATAQTLDWLGHIDGDEFLLPDRPLRALLAAAPDDAASLRLRPAEALAPPSGPPQHFKITHTAAGQPKAVLHQIYPTFGGYLTGGFLSHSQGKVFARTGIPDTRLAIHRLKYRGQEVTHTAPLPDIVLGHLHAPSWAQFRAHLDFRRAQGSYRARPDGSGLSDILTALAQETGETGLRALFDEVCADTPQLRARLDAHGMLLTRPLNPDAAVIRVFGTPP